MERLRPEDAQDGHRKGAYCVLWPTSPCMKAMHSRQIRSMALLLLPRTDYGYSNTCICGMGVVNT
eukprot:1342679-Prymnesium_polylepis.1